MPPGFVVQVPFDGLSQTHLEGFLNTVAQGILSFARGNRIAAVVAKAVRDESDQGVRRLTRGHWGFGIALCQGFVINEGLVDYLAEGTDQFDIG